MTWWKSIDGVWDAYSVAIGWGSWRPFAYGVLLMGMCMVIHGYHGEEKEASLLLLRKKRRVLEYSRFTTEPESYSLYA